MSQPLHVAAVSPAESTPSHSAPPTLSISPGGASRHDPVANALATGKFIVLFVRQSTMKQRLRNQGSGVEQFDQTRHLTRYGVQSNDPRIRIVDARGESGRRRAFDASAGATGGQSNRAAFEVMLSEISAGNVAMVLVSAVDRISRNRPDSARFFEACERHRVLLIVNGHPRQPKSRTDQFQNDIESATAKFVVAGETEKLLRGHFQLAQSLQCRMNLPSGLVYACPRDPDFRRRLTAAGLGDYLTDEALARHRVRTKGSDGQELLVLPYPDADVHTTMQLRFEWLLETRSLSRVAQRIVEGAPGWPPHRKGQIPVSRESLWRYSKEIQWRSATKGALRRWFASPSLYGTYVLDFPALQDISTEEGVTYTVCESDAFPSIVPDDVWPDVEDILTCPQQNVRSVRPAGGPRANHTTMTLEATGAPEFGTRLVRRRRPAKGSKKRVFRGARLHALARLHCGHPVAADDQRAGDGGQCDLRMSAKYPLDGGYWYGSLNCTLERDHYFVVFPTVEQIVVDALLEVLNPDALAEGLGRLKRVQGESATEVRALHERQARARNAAAEARRLAAQSADDPRLQQDYQYDAKQYTREAADIEQQIAHHAKSVEVLMGQRAEDLAAIEALVADFPGLVSAARSADIALGAELATVFETDRSRYTLLAGREGLLRRIVSAAGLKVSCALTPTDSVAVTIRFPTGEAMVRYVDAAFIESTHAERVWAHHQWSVEGRPPEHVAATLNAMRVRAGRLPSTTPPAPVGRPTHRDRGRLAHWWTAASVRGAATYHAWRDHVASPTHSVAATTVAALAEEYGCSEEEVLARVLRGTLGRARVADGTLLVEATVRQRAAAFPENERAFVAAAKGWPVEDMVRLSELKAQYPALTTNDVASFARLGAGIVHDRAGRRYTRRSQFMTNRERLVRELEKPEHVDKRDLDRAAWTPLAEARRRYPDVDPETLKKRGRAVRVGGQRARQGVSFVWLGPEVDLLLRGTSLEEAVAARAADLGVPLDPTDFVRREVAEEICRRSRIGPYPSTLVQLRKSGRVLVVMAKDPGRRSPLPIQYFYMPPNLRDGASRDALRAWFAGVGLPASFEAIAREQQT